MPVKSVFITGSNRGIGLAFARHYVAAGWKVIAASRDLEGASDLKELAVANIVHLDVTNEASIAAVADQFKGEPIDLVINNAGISGAGTLADVTKEDLIKLFEYSYRSTKAALNMLNKSLAADLKSDNIITLALHPGYVVTRMTGHKGEVTADESVAGRTKIIAEATPEHSAKYFDFHGSFLPW
ncbi:hypothetical protein PHYBOEH_007357 [Phytophthora boehmeriae]|uniref:Short chain dehydrogenase n=1 Tax=Phytophthora boehmeriae TaxID=109152 RepID=A0A8T1WCM0_9STRA|nr:hypothetical protein PHYBOEH_007357 [Phytophthora boehmeriae]